MDQASALQCVRERSAVAKKKALNLQELNRYFAVRHLDSSWCFQSEARSRERRRVEILATNGYKVSP